MPYLNLAPRRRGMGALPVPARAGVDPAIAERACTTARGTWTPAGCLLPEGPSLPGYCDWVPFATSLFPECKLPTAADLVNMGGAPYTAYMIGQMSGIEREQEVMAQNVAESDDLASKQDCEYRAVQESPGLAQIIGPTALCWLRDNWGWIAGGFGAIVLLPYILPPGGRR